MNWVHVLGSLFGLPRCFWRGRQEGRRGAIPPWGGYLITNNIELMEGPVDFDFIVVANHQPDNLKQSTYKLFKTLYLSTR